MSALPRINCIVCNKSVPVRRNGCFREHIQYRHSRVQCPGSGKAATSGRIDGRSAFQKERAR